MWRKDKYYVLHGMTLNWWFTVLINPFCVELRIKLAAKIWTIIENSKFAVTLVSDTYECSFGTGKRIYRANDIRAKLPDTARCWTGMCYFVKNVMKFLRELCLALTELWRFFINFVTMRGHICYPLSVARN